MTTNWYEVHELEQLVGRVNGEIEDAVVILKDGLLQHTKNGVECNCKYCIRAREWIARNSKNV